MDLEWRCWVEVALVPGLLGACFVDCEWLVDANFARGEAGACSDARLLGSLWRNKAQRHRDAGALQSGGAEQEKGAADEEEATWLGKF